MVSVTQRITQYNKSPKQPRGGFINPRTLEVLEMPDSLGPFFVDAENLSPTLAGTAVDVLARLARLRADHEVALGEAATQALSVSLRGAERIQAMYPDSDAGARAMGALARISVAQVADTRWHVVLDSSSVEAICLLAGFDVGLRAGPEFWNPMTPVVPDTMTVRHIIAMVDRLRDFFAADAHGPIVADGFDFRPEMTGWSQVDDFAALMAFRTGEQETYGGYTRMVDSGDGDVLTADTVWDVKVSVNPPTKDHTLQVVMYALMGRASGRAEFQCITHVGLVNPRLGRAYRIALADIPAATLEAIRHSVIGYGQTEVAA